MRRYSILLEDHFAAISLAWAKRLAYESQTFDESWTSGATNSRVSNWPPTRATNFWTWRRSRL
jgi:hypothetical protein